jgi:hypothetical protein
MDPNPRTHPLVRGGFAPFAGGWKVGSFTLGQLKGLGDLCDPSDVSCLMSGPYVNPASSSLQIDSSSLLSQVPTSLWLLMGGFIIFAFVLPSGRR